MEALKDCKYVFKEVDHGNGAHYEKQYQCEYKAEIRGIMATLDNLSSPASIPMCLVELIFLAAFWLCTIFSPRDFTRNYLITVATPMSTKFLLRIACIIYSFINDPFYRARGRGIVTTLFGLNNAFSTYIFVFATPIFIFMVMRTANKRNHFTPTQHWLPFLICGITVPVVLCLAWLVPWPYYTYNTISVVVILVGKGATLLITIMLLLSCCMCCCCSSATYHMDYSDPVIYNARSRLGWTCVFLCFVPIVADFAASPQFYDILDAFHTTMVMIPVFLFLPTYRSSLFCCCKNHREKNLPSKIAPPTSTTVGISTVITRPLATPTTQVPSLMAPPTLLAPPPVPPTFNQAVYNPPIQTLMIPNHQQQSLNNLYPSLNVPSPLTLDQPTGNPTLNIGGHVLLLPQSFTIQTPHATIVSSPR